MNTMTNHQSLRTTLAPSPNHVENESVHPGLLELGERILRHKVGLAAWMLLCVAIAIAYVAVTPPEFTAYTQIILERHRPYVVVADGQGDSTQSSLDAAQADSEIQVVKSERLLRMVFNTLDLAHSPEFMSPRPRLTDHIKQWISNKPKIKSPDEIMASAFLRFMDNVSVRRLGQSYVLEIGYRASTPDFAARAANSITSAYIWDQVQIKAALALRGTEFLQRRVSDLKAEEEDALNAVREGAIPPSRFPDADARVISAALKPTGKSYPSSGLMVAFALTFGLLSGLAFIVARHGLDRTIRSQRQIGRLFGLANLAVIPRVSAQQLRQLFTEGSSSIRSIEFAEGLRATAAAIMFSPYDNRRRAIGIVSWRRGEGKTTLAINLAFLLAGADQPTMLIDGDLRDPSLTKVFGTTAGPGISEMLSQHAVPSQVLLRPNLTFVPASGQQGIMDETIFLGSNTMRQFIEKQRIGKHLILDLPATSHSADIQSVAPMLDGLIVVAEANRVTSEELNDLVTRLSSLVPIIGVVLNKATANPHIKKKRR